MSRQRTNNVIGCLAIGLLIGFMLSLAVTTSTKSLAETCSTWVVLPLVGILAIARRGG